MTRNPPAASGDTPEQLRSRGDVLDRAAVVEGLRVERAPLLDHSPHRRATAADEDGLALRGVAKPGPRVERL